MTGRSTLALASLLAVLLLLGTWYGADRERSDPSAAARSVADGSTAPAASADPLAPVEPGADDAGRSDASRSDRVAVLAGGEIFVCDLEGEPIEAALVRTSTGPPVELTTDANGRCRSPLGHGIGAWLDVTAPGYAGTSTFHDGRSETRVELPPAVVLHGRVLDADTREPVPGASVRCSGPPRAHSPSEATCDALGRFRMLGVPAVEELRIYADADGYEHRGTSWDTRDLHDDARLELLMRRLVALELRLVDASSERPLVGLRLIGRSGGDATTDEEGRASLELAPEGDGRTLEFRIEGPDFYELYCSLDAEAPSPTEIRLPPPARIEGFVTDEGGRAVANARVRFELEGATSPPTLELPHGEGSVAPRWSPGSPESDAEGHFRSPALFPGEVEYRVTVRHDRYPDLTETAGPISAGATVRRDLILRAPAPIALGSIRGSVVLNGEPAGASIVWRAGADVGIVRTARRSYGGEPVPEANEGTYRSDEIPVGEIELEVRLDDHHLDRVERYLPGTKVTVEVAPGEMSVHDFAFELPMAQIGGRVLTGDGSAPPELVVRVSDTEDRFDQFASTGPDGRWRDEVIGLDWEYVVSVRHAGASFRREGVRPGDLDVDFVVPVLVDVPIRVLDAATDLPIQEWELAYRPAGTEAFRAGREIEPGRRSNRPDGRFLVPLPPGEHELFVSARGPGYQSERVQGVVVRASGENDLLEIRLEPGLELDIVLEDGVELPQRHGVRMLLLEAELWETVHHGAELLPGEPRIRYGSDALVFGHGPFYSSGTLGTRFVRFDDDRRATMRALAPGLWRFKAVPADVVIEPEHVRMPREGPLRIRWQRDP